MSRCIRVIISGTCPVARGSTSGGTQPSTVYARLNARSLRWATSHQGTLLGRGDPEDLVVDVGDVPAERDLVTAGPQPAGEDVEDHARPDVPDVRRRLHGGAAQVQRRLTGRHRREVAHGARSSVVKAERHGARLRDQAPCPGGPACGGIQPPPGGAPLGVPVARRSGPQWRAAQGPAAGSPAGTASPSPAQPGLPSSGMACNTPGTLACLEYPQSTRDTQYRLP